MGKGVGGHHRGHEGKTDEWLTPPEITAELGPFDLDPCSPIIRPWPTAAKHYTTEDNGLSREWNGFVWLNPPYGPETSVWLKKMAQHDNGFALIFARTETYMFFESVWNHASAILFIKGRLYFHTVDGKRAKNNSGGPSCIISYGDEAKTRLQNCTIDGKLVLLK